MTSLRHVVAVGSVLLAGCPLGEDAGSVKSAQPCLKAVNTADLGKVVGCVYEPGARFAHSGPVELLTSESRSQSSSYEVAADGTVISARIVGIEQIGDRRFASVSVRRNRGRCEVTSTHTWVEEKKGWRRIWLPAFERAAQKEEFEDDARGSLKMSNDWLSKDPFALLPLSNLYELLRHGPDLVKYKILDRLPESRHGDADQLFHRALKINPDDDFAVKLGIQYAKSFREARSHFERVARNACARSSHLAFLVSRFEDAEELVAFVEKENDRLTASGVGGHSPDGGPWGGLGAPAIPHPESHGDLATTTGAAPDQGRRCDRGERGGGGVGEAAGPIPRARMARLRSSTRARECGGGVRAQGRELVGPRTSVTR